jgi:hypothetical protein
MPSRWLIPVVALVVLAPSSFAQSFEVLPEIDAYYRFNPNVRMYFQAKDTREGGEQNSGEIGPSLDFHIKKLSELAEITKSDLDESKSQLLLFAVGYRYLPYSNAPPTNRFEPYFVVNVPFRGKLFVSDRNRADLDWSNGKFSWHYRNRVSVERPWTIGGYHLSPYISAEFWYTSQYEKWSTTSVFAGCIFPFGKHVGFNPYYEHQNNTGKTPNHQLNQLGLILNLWF